MTTTFPIASNTKENNHLLNFFADKDSVISGLVHFIWQTMPTARCFESGQIIINPLDKFQIT